MLLFFVPGANIGNVATNTSVATVDGEPISTRDFALSYSAQIENLMERAGSELDLETIKALGIPVQILDGMIATKIMEIEAERFGIDVTEEELRKAVENNPNFQVDGKFIGVENYKALLTRNNYSVADFEADLRLTQLATKLQRIVTDSIEISDHDLRNEFSRTTQKTQIDYVILRKDDYTKRIKPAESDLKAYFEQHKDNYRIKEKRRAQYLLVPTAEILPTIEVSEQEILDEWEQMPHEETVEASHILFAVADESKDIEVRARAEAVLMRAKAWENFEELAREYSEDSGSAGQGGFLGSFQRGDMVPEFEAAAFSLNPGEISDLVKTSYGYHIIKVLSHETPTLESSRSSLRSSIQARKAEELAKQKAEEAAKAAANQPDLALLGQDLGVHTEIRETDLFKNDDSPLDLGISSALLANVFTLKEIGSIGKAVEHPLGFAVPKLAEVEMPKPGNFEDSRSRIENDYIETQSAELMKTEAARLSEDAGEKESLEAAAKEMGLKTQTSQEFTISESPDQEIGTNSTLNTIAFEMEPGEVSAPQSLQNNTIVFQVKSRTPFDESAFQEQKEEMRSQMLQAQKGSYFQSYILAVMDRLDRAGKIRRNTEVIESLLSN
jgi:peptidyl-prolyl cis-trans isomerase D